MKILILSSTVSQFISVGKITTELYFGLQKAGHEVFCYYLDCEKNSYEDNLYPISSKLYMKLNYQISIRTNYKLDFSTPIVHRIRKKILEFKPDVIQVIQPSSQFINNYKLFDILGRIGVPCVYSMIDENPYLGLCDNGYNCETFKEQNGCKNCTGTDAAYNKDDIMLWNVKSARQIAKLKENGYGLCKNLFFTAPKWVIERAKSSFLLRNKKFFVIDEFVNNKDVFIPRNYEPLLKKYEIDSSKIIILNVAKYSNIRKGVRFFLELARRLESDSRFLFINVGYDGDFKNLPKNFKPIGFIKNQRELSEFYSMADLYLISSSSDTMPNACLEALSCGTPICGFNISGIPYVAEEPLGFFTEPYNIEQLAEKIKNIKKKDYEITQKCRNYAVTRFSTEVFIKKMLSVYEVIQNDFK